MKKQNLEKKGITIIALIITIIVMLILVGVTITVALNGGLFTTAQDATTNTIIAAEKEQLLSAIAVAYDVGTGTINKEKLKVNLGEGWNVEGENAPYTVTSPKGNKYTVKEDGTIEYAGNGGGQTPPSGDDIPSTYTETVTGLPETVEAIKYKDLETVTNLDIKAAVDAGKIKAVLKEGEYIALIPTGFDVSTIEGENTITGGLVIKEGKNEYVFIPCTEENYTEDNFGPLTEKGVVSDSQDSLDRYYGQNYYSYEDFNYAQDKIAIENSINKYKGFYVGRYETTISERIIGSQKGVTVLTAGATIKEGTNLNYNNQPYYYRWYGLYKAQKDLYAENPNVFSSMITSKEWETIEDFTGYGGGTRKTNTYTTTPDLSGSAYKGTTDQFDLTKNIYDLAGNLFEWTLTSGASYKMTYRGGNYNYGQYSTYNAGNDYPNRIQRYLWLSPYTLYKINLILINFV